MIYKKLYTAYPVSIYDRKIVVSVGKDNKVIKSFHKKFVDITPKQVSVKTRAELNVWIQDPMLFYFNQYKFALYCASTLCGVSKDDLTKGFELTRAIMNFHVMYQTKRILAQMNCKVPGDDDFNPNNNPYNKTEYHKILNEFNIDASMIPEIDQPSNGLGYMYGETHGKMIQKHYYEYNGIKPPTYPATGEENWYINVKMKDFDSGNYTFKQDGGASKVTGLDHGFIDTLTEIKQDGFYYQRLIADHTSQTYISSKFGFPERGIVRINDSIRAYVYCLLGAQTEVRTDYMSERSGDAEQKFLELVNDLINKKQSIEESIDNFQDALSKTKGYINYVIGSGLYEIPSDLNLNKLQRSVSGFNTELITAGNLAKKGFYNTVKQPPTESPTVAAEQPVKVKQPIVTSKVDFEPESGSGASESGRASRDPNFEANQVHIRIKRDEHKGSKIFIGGLIVTAGILYKYIK